MIDDPDVVAGYVDAALAAEFPDLRLSYTVVDAVPGRSPDAVRERLRSAVRQAWEEHPGVTASIGIALDRPSSDTDPATGVWRLVDRADAAMYEAKQAGRDRVELAPPLVPLPRAAHPVVRLDRPA